jgi:hypothetical protein
VSGKSGKCHGGDGMGGTVLHGRSCCSLQNRLMQDNLPGWTLCSTCVSRAVPMKPRGRGCSEAAGKRARNSREYARYIPPEQA